MVEDVVRMSPDKRPLADAEARRYKPPPLRVRRREDELEGSRRRSVDHEDADRGQQLGLGEEEEIKRDVEEFQAGLPLQLVETVNVDKSNPRRAP